MPGAGTKVVTLCGALVPAPHRFTGESDVVVDDLPGAFLASETAGYIPVSVCSSAIGLAWQSLTRVDPGWVRVWHPGPEDLPR